MTQIDALAGSESIAVPSWDGFIVIDLKGNLICWKGSKTPRLYSSVEVSGLSVPEGWALAPIRVVPTTFAAIPRPMMNHDYASGLRATLEDAARARVVAAAEVSMLPVTAPPAQKPEPEARPRAAKPPKEKAPVREPVPITLPGPIPDGTLRDRILHVINNCGAEVRANEIADVLGYDKPNVVVVYLATLFQEGQIERLGRGLYAKRLKPAIPKVRVEPPSTAPENDTPEPSAVPPLKF